MNLALRAYTDRCSESNEKKADYCALPTFWERRSRSRSHHQRAPLDLRSPKKIVKKNGQFFFAQNHQIAALRPIYLS